MNERSYYVYIMASMSKVLYWSDRRFAAKSLGTQGGVQEGFTKRY